MPKRLRAATQIRIDEELFNSIKSISERELRTLNSQIEFFLINAVQDYKAKNGLLVLQPPELDL